MRAFKALDLRESISGPRALSAILACLGLLPSASAIDVERYEVFKGQMFVQSGTNSPSLATNLPFVFQAVAFPTIPAWVTAPAIETPAGSDHPLTLTVQANGSVYSTNFVFNDAASSQVGLDAAYGVGEYTLSYTGKDDGAASSVISLLADDFPSAPTVSNLVAARSIDPDANFTLRFSAWPSADNNDVVQLIILDTNGNPVLATPAPFEAYPTPPLAATNTSVVISNGVFSYGQTYTAMLTFTRITTNNLYSFTGFPFLLGGFFTQTTFTLQTEPPPSAPPPPPVAPATLANSFLSFTVADGSGPFASGGAFQLFTLPLGTNYLVLGKVGDGFATGGYSYAKTGTNTAALSLTDVHAGLVSLQISFTTSNAGTFVLSNSLGAQTGSFSLGQSYAGVTPPELYLPACTKGQFQTGLSGQAGGVYEIDSSSDLHSWSFLTNILLVNDTTNFVDDLPPQSAPKFYRARLSSINFAPPSLADATLNETVTGGSSPLSTNGIDLWIASTNGSSYQIVGGPGATNVAGSYSYVVTGPNTAELSYTDSASSGATEKQLFFTSASTGFFFATNAASPGFQSGNFTLSAVPASFLGNVGFTPDTARSASVLPVLGMSASLSVTDAAGYTWTLNIPADAMIAPTAITMTPFGSINNSQSTVPVFSGVKLEPEGLLFDNALTLTFSSPVAPAQPPILMMADGSGNGLHFAGTSNGPSNSYSTALLHFSSGAAGNGAGANGNYGNQVAAQLAQAYAQAYAQLRNLENITPTPAPPPDILYECPMTQGQLNQKASAYANKLFARELAAIQNLLNVGASYVRLTGSDPNAAAETSVIREVIEFVCYDKVERILNQYGNNPLKWFAVRAAAAFVNNLDQQYGGAGEPAWNTQLLAALSGPVLDYYFQAVTSSHVYAMLNSLKFLQQLIDAGSGDSSGDQAFFQRLANAFTFTVKLSLSDQGLNQSIQANGTVTVTGSSSEEFLGVSEAYPISGTDQVNYTSGSAPSSQLQLPLSWAQEIVLIVDGCAQTVSLFWTSTGSSEEMWSQPPPGPPYLELDDLIDDSDAAFQGLAATTEPTWDCDFVTTGEMVNGTLREVINIQGQTYGGVQTVTANFDISHTPQ